MTGDPKSESRVSVTRKAAFDILRAVARGEGHSDDLLRARVVDRMAPADRNLTTALVLGVLRWQVQLDDKLRPLLKRPNGKLDAVVQIALRLGAFQILHMDRIPARAAIDESVELTKQAGHKFASGMVNAVLRKLATDTGAKESRETDAYPAWIRERWTEFFGEEQTCAICAHGQTHAALAVRVVDAAAEEELAQAGVVLKPGELLTRARIVVSGDVAGTAAFREGRVRIQDEGSQLVAEIAGHGDAILDCCAAPGGKTLILAERNPEARIVACEASEQRLASLRKRLRRLGERVEFRLADATELDATGRADEAAYDVVLADVPCSGTGTLGRNPEIRHRLMLEDLPRQAERQEAILASALRAVKAGGRVVYSTCSLEPEENEQVVAAVLRDRKDVRVVPVTERIEAMLVEGVLTEAGAERLRGCSTPEGLLRLFPGDFGTDGFFVAVMESGLRS